jgi:multidrug efflux pump subunit AcrA (membrane-fusion protein)
MRLLLGSLGLLLIVGGGLGWYFFGRGHTARADLVTHKAQREKLQVTIVERGTLESADNREVIAKVKARTQGSTVATTIKWVIDDGALVKQGQELVLLDDSGLQEQLKTEQITLDSAEAAWIASAENYKIVESQNNSDIKTAEIALQLAKLDLEKYLKGDYEQSLKDVEGRTIMAESDLEMWRDRAAWSTRMVKKHFVTPSQAQADRDRLQSATIALEKVQEEKRVLTEFTYVRTKTDLESKVAEAGRALDRVQKQATAKAVTAHSDRQSKRSIYEKEKKRFEEIEEEINKCVITAPQDGLVVYYVSDQNRFGNGAQQGIVAQGEPVREGQKLMRIPDLKHMLVSTRIHEAMIRRVRGDVIERTGFSDLVQASLLATSDPLTNAVASMAFAEVRPAFSEHNRNYEQRTLEDGLSAVIRVDSYPDKILHGHVHQVGTVASQQDWFASDVKVYQAMISVDEEVEGLKPGMSAEVTIFTDDKLDNVLTVPVQAVLPATADGGGHPRCFVKTATGDVEPRDVEVGLNNDKMIEIKSGVVEGEEVVLNPRSFLSDKEKSKQGAGQDKNGQGPGMQEGKPGGPPGGPPNGQGPKDKGSWPGKPGGPGGMPTAGGAGK